MGEHVRAFKDIEIEIEESVEFKEDESVVSEDLLEAPAFKRYIS